MPDIDNLQRRIKERLAASDESRRLRQNHVQRIMKEWEERHARYTTIADHLVNEIIRPRAQRLKEHFDQATFPEARNTRHSCVCEFPHSERYPASVRLELGVTRDADVTTVVVEYKLEIAPVFFAFQGQDRLALPLPAVDGDKVAAWVEAKILGFVDTYLKLETTDSYQADNVTVDPVCLMRINTNHAAASIEYHGVRYHFCLEECLAKFQADPERYVDSGRRAKA
jgi:YHS domain-containing protein